MNTPDIVIIGAGVIGLTAALQIRRRSSASITVLEKANSLGQGSTGASVAVLRHRYSLNNTIRLARDGVHAYREWSAFTQLTEPMAQFERAQVLWMTGGEKGWAEKESSRLKRLNIDAAVLDDQTLSEQFPAISTCTLNADTDTGETHICQGGGAHLLELDAGYTDPMAVMRDLFDACKQHDVNVRFNSEVTGIEQSSGRTTGVQLADGRRFSSAVIINAAGPWCMHINKAADISMPFKLTPTRIQVLYIDLPDEVARPLPVCVDPGGTYFRPQSRAQQLVVGSTLEEDENEIITDPDRFDMEPDESFKIKILHRLHHRLPDLPYRGKIHGYCGLYTINRADVHPIVGQTELKGFYVANGFSGHGFKLAPAIGSLLAREITGLSSEFDTHVDREFLSIDRAPLITSGEKSVLA